LPDFDERIWDGQGIAIENASDNTNAISDSLWQHQQIATTPFP
jgi:hypothetical protein